MTKPFTAVLLALAMLTSSCSTTGVLFSEGMLKEKHQGAVIGAIGGGLLAGGLAYLATGDETAAAAAAIAGGLAGGSFGYRKGKHIAARKAEYAAEEDYLVACINEAQETRQMIASHNEELRGIHAQVLSENRELIAMTADARDSKAVRIAQQRSQRLERTITSQSKDIDREIELQQNAIALIEDDGLDASAVQAEINKLSREKTQLENLTAALVEQRTGYSTS